MAAETESLNNAYTVSVLLVGEGARNAPILRDYLRKRGCAVSFADCCNDAERTLRERRYDLVLSDFLLSDGTAFQLMALLRGTDSTMFFSNTVEHGCWWMNAIYEGADHSEAPGMRPKQFRVLLDQFLLDRLLRHAIESQSKQCANRSANPAVELWKQ
jgi:DNA-binding NtrC family response regulator